MTVFDQGSQKERAEIMRYEARLRHPSHVPREAQTYFEIANRPSAENLPRPSLEVPRLPASSPWSRDPTGPEPPIDGTAEGNRVGVALGGASPKRGTP
jgi:hypothetical protein